MTETERAKQLAANHWSYVESLLKAHNVGEAPLQLVGFHYRSAMIHGYGHGAEDERNSSLKISPARYAEIHTPLTAEEVNEIAHPCSNCMDEQPCAAGLRQVNGECIYHRPKVADQQHPRKEGP